MTNMKSSPSADRSPSAECEAANPRVIAALEEYLRLCEDGVVPDPQTFTARYPDIRDTLSGALAGLRFMQDAAPQVEASSEGIARSFELNLSDLQPLGDFRIIREIGRGGMGIVYEAEQLSLARRVALKVLPFAAVLDPRHLQRFKNEALAAASLDHPNIVEVYAVGCERGVHFYAMRYVEGQTLAAVIEALRTQDWRAGDVSPPISRSDASRDESTPLRAPAEGRSGEVRERGIAEDLGSVGNGLSAVPEQPHDVARGDSIRPSSLVLRNSAMDTSPIAALSTLRTQRPLDFFRLVAELGIQAAEALDHAHQLGIVHRDIKPSNLMLECSHLAPRDGASMSHHAERDDYTAENSALRIPNSKLYIADFGLARIESDAATGLTMTGDLLGTLRYMSPEQAEGKSAILDHRTDIYSLGITLYELLTLRPAFTTEDRQALLRQIASDEPPPPRKFKPEIRPDLETIVLKAIRKEAADRYFTARDLADDLRRFVNQQPIAARPQKARKRFLRWCQRHIVATVLTSLICVLVAVAACGWLIYDARYQLSEYHRALSEAERAIVSPRHGWTWEITEKLGGPIPSFADSDDLHRIRSVRAASAGGIDMREIASWAEGFPVAAVAFSPDAELLALGQNHDARQVSVLLLNVASGDVVTRATFPAERNSKQSHPELDGVRSLAFSGDGSYLYAGARSGWIHRFELSINPARRHSWRAHLDHVTDLAFYDGNRRELWSASKDRTVKRWEYPDPADSPLAVYDRPKPVRSLALTIASPHIAWTGGSVSGVELIPLAYDEQLARDSTDMDMDYVAYAHTSYLLAASFDENRRIALIDKVRRELAGELRDSTLGGAPDSSIVQMRFCPGRPLLVTAHVDGRVKVWDVAAGHPLFGFQVAGNGAPNIGFSPDGRLLAVGTENGVRIFELRAATAARWTALTPRPLLDFDLDSDSRHVMCALPEPGMWGKYTGMGVIRHWDLIDDADCKLWSVFRPFGGETRITAHPFLRRYAITSDAWNSLSLYDHDQQTATKWQYHAQGRIGDVVFSRTGKYVWVADERQPSDDSATLLGCLTRIPDDNAEAAEHWLNEEGYNRELVSHIYCLSAETKYVVAGCRDHSVRIFRQDPFELVAAIPTGRQIVRSAAIARHEQFALLGSDSGRVGVLRLPAGPIEWFEAHHNFVRSIHISPDDRFAATGGDDAQLRIWRLDPVRSSGSPEPHLSLRVPARIRKVRYSADEKWLALLVQGERAIRVLATDHLMP